MKRASRLRRDDGNIAASRELLKQAADLGSGTAALELARSYEAARAETPLESETNARLRSPGMSGPAPSASMRPLAKHPLRAHGNVFGT